MITRVFSKSVVITIHGACRGNGTSSARGAYGVYFGEGSPYNEPGLLPETERQGSNAAVVYAAQRALEILEDRVTRDPSIEERK
jgi:ribonuclease HI